MAGRRTPNSHMHARAHAHVPQLTPHARPTTTSLRLTRRQVSSPAGRSPPPHPARPTRRGAGPGGPPSMEGLPSFRQPSVAAGRRRSSWPEPSRRHHRSHPNNAGPSSTVGPPAPLWPQLLSLSLSLSLSVSAMPCRARPDACMSPATVLLDELVATADQHELTRSSPPPPPRAARVPQALVATATSSDTSSSAPSPPPRAARVHQALVAATASSTSSSGSRRRRRHREQHEFIRFSSPSLIGTSPSGARRPPRSARVHQALDALLVQQELGALVAAAPPPTKNSLWVEWPQQPCWLEL